MNPILRNILAVIAGLFIGGVVNNILILISGSIIPAPNGADVSTREGLVAAMPFFEPKNFIFPFLAHALGTFAGSAATIKIASSNKTKLAFIVGAFFLLAGIIMITILPSPVWYTVLDLMFAYIPMSYLAIKLFYKKAQRI